MKQSLRHFFLAFIAFQTCYGLIRAQTIVETATTYNATSLPGSATDFYIYGAFAAAGGTYYGTGSSSPELYNLTDFSGAIAFGDNATASRSNTLIAPTGSTSGLGYLFTINSGQTTSADLASFTLLSSSSFNYKDFDVWVAVNNTGDTYDNGVTLTLNQSNNITNVVPTVLQSITSNAGSASNSVTLVEFNVLGATSGEVLDVGGAGASRSTVSAVSFESVAAPEPSISSLLLLGGLGLLAFFRFRALRA